MMSNQPPERPGPLGDGANPPPPGAVPDARAMMEAVDARVAKMKAELAASIAERTAQAAAAPPRPAAPGARSARPMTPAELRADIARARASVQAGRPGAPVPAPVTPVVPAVPSVREVPAVGPVAQPPAPPPPARAPEPVTSASEPILAEETEPAQTPAVTEAVKPVVTAEPAWAPAAPAESAPPAEPTVAGVAKAPRTRRRDARTPAPEAAPVLGAPVVIAPRPAAEPAESATVVPAPEPEAIPAEPPEGAAVAPSAAPGRRRWLIPLLVGLVVVAVGVGVLIWRLHSPSGSAAGCGSATFPAAGATTGQAAKGLVGNDQFGCLSIPDGQWYVSALTTNVGGLVITEKPSLTEATTTASLTTVAVPGVADGAVAESAAKAYIASQSDRLTTTEQGAVALGPHNLPAFCFTGTFQNTRLPATKTCYIATTNGLAVLTVRTQDAASPIFTIFDTYRHP